MLEISYCQTLFICLKKINLKIENECSDLITCVRAGVSNTRLAGRMWPAWCVCAARVIIKSSHIIVKIAVFVIKRPFLPSFAARGYIFCLYAARELHCIPNAALVLIWVWDPCSRTWYGWSNFTHRRPEQSLQCLDSIKHTKLVDFHTIVIQFDI